MNNTSSLKESAYNVFVGRFVMTALTLLVLAITAIEVGLAFNLRFAEAWMAPIPPFTNVPMWVGSFWWAMLALAGWIEAYRSNRDLLFVAVVCSGVTVGSVAGIYNPDFRMFAFCANAAIWVLATLAMIAILPNEWRKRDGPFSTEKA